MRVIAILLLLCGVADAQFVWRGQHDDQSCSGCTEDPAVVTVASDGASATFDAGMYQFDLQGLLTGYEVENITYCFEVVIADSANTANSVGASASVANADPGILFGPSAAVYTNYVDDAGPLSRAIIVVDLPVVSGLGANGLYDLFELEAVLGIDRVVHDVQMISGPVGIPGFGTFESLIVMGNGVLTAVAPAANPGIVVVEHRFRVFVRGDTNRRTGSLNDGAGDCTVDIADSIGVLRYLFAAEPNTCHDAMDFNDDGAVDIADSVYCTDYLFGGGPPPPAPFAVPLSGVRDIDPTLDSLSCALSQDACP